MICRLPDAIARQPCSDEGGTAPVHSGTLLLEAVSDSQRPGCKRVVDGLVSVLRGIITSLVS